MTAPKSAETGQYREWQHTKTNLPADVFAGMSWVLGHENIDCTWWWTAGGLTQTSLWETPGGPSHGEGRFPILLWVLPPRALACSIWEKCPLGKGKATIFKYTEVFCSWQGLPSGAINRAETAEGLSEPNWPEGREINFNPLQPP